MASFGAFKKALAVFNRAIPGMLNKQVSCWVALNLCRQGTHVHTHTQLRFEPTQGWSYRRAKQAGHLHLGTGPCRIGTGSPIMTMAGFTVHAGGHISILPWGSMGNRYATEPTARSMHCFQWQVPTAQLSTTVSGMLQTASDLHPDA